MKLLKILSEARKKNLEEKLDIAFDLMKDSSLNYTARNRHREKYNLLNSTYYQRYGIIYVPEKDYETRSQE